MQRTLIQLTEDEFDNQYPLVRNHLDANASWSDNEGPGCLFETYGEEIEFVRQQDPLTIWTVIDGHDDDMYIASGYHFVNRIGYLISTVPVPPDVDIEVRIPRSDDSELENEEEKAPPIEDTPRGLSEIAFEFLDIPTLVTRKSDSHDFYNVAVWAVEAALKAAFEAGANSKHAKPESVEGSPTRFDAYEIQPCLRNRKEIEPDEEVIVPCDPDEAGLWRLYGNIPGEGLKTVGDFSTGEQAEEVFARITGQRYTRQVGTTGGSNDE